MWTSGLQLSWPLRQWMGFEGVVIEVNLELASISTPVWPVHSVVARQSTLRCGAFTLAVRQSGPQA